MDNKKCPLCGYEEIVLRKQRGHRSMMALDILQILGRKKLYQ